MLAELKIKYAGTSGKFTQPRIAISKSDGSPIHSPTYLVHAALVARPAAALALDVLLHEAEAARRAADRRRRPVGRVAQLELNGCKDKEELLYVTLLAPY